MDTHSPTCISGSGATDFFSSKVRGHMDVANVVKFDSEYQTYLKQSGLTNEDARSPLGASSVLRALAVSAFALHVGPGSTIGTQ